MIVRRDETRDLDEPLRRQMRRGQDAAVGTVADHGEKQRVLAGQHGEAGWPSREQLERLRKAARTVLDADDVATLGKAQQRVVAEVDRRPVRNVVDEELSVGRVRESREVLQQSMTYSAVLVPTNGE